MLWSTACYRVIAYGVKDNPAEIIATIAVKRGNRTLNAGELKYYMEALSENDLSKGRIVFRHIEGRAPQARPRR